MSSTPPTGSARITAAARQWLTPLGVQRFVAFRPDGPLPVADAQSAVRQANARSRAEYGDAAAVGDVVAEVGTEIHLRLTAVGSDAARESWLDALAGALPGGVFERPRRVHGPERVLQRLVDLRPVKTFVGHRIGTTPADAFERMRASFALPGATAYVTGDEAGFPHRDDAGLDAVLAPMVTGNVEVLLVDQRDNASHLVWTDPLRASGFRSGVDDEWRHHLGEARRALESLADTLDHGFAARTSALTDWNGLHQEQPIPPAGAESRTFFRSPGLWATWVADARGLQLLTQQHLDKASDLSAWQVRREGDRFVVEAREPEAWFAAAAPDPAVLAQARRDFGSMIVTGDVLVAARKSARQAARA